MRELEKSGSKEEQDENLNDLIARVREYKARSDEYGLRRFRGVYRPFRAESVNSMTWQNTQRYRNALQPSQIPWLR